MKRFFNTAGPVNPRLHYCLPPLERLDLDELMLLIEQQKYFVLHAPRQTGKTSTLLALMDHLNATGRYRCAYVNVEVAQAAREQVGPAMRAILGELGTWARGLLKDGFVDQVRLRVLEEYGPYAAFGEVLSRWATHDPDRPLVLLIDEIDALVGDTLISVLRQLRAGYARRPDSFPQSIVLCGIRDVRDYRIQSSAEQSIITGGSAFNIKAKSLRLGDFSQGQMESLLHRHTLETGQGFTPEALARIWELTRGQPWLVNALGYETCFETKASRDRSRPISMDLVEQAKENLILRRETHLDQLADKLGEERVRRVIEPIVASLDWADRLRQEDVEYVLDLGLIRRDRQGGIHLANAIYKEVIPRQLTWASQAGMVQETAWFLTKQGRLDMHKLLAAFQEFFRQHSEHWVERFQYKEAGPQLLLQAFLQRIVNGGGRIEREYGLGRMRTDLLVTWPLPGRVQKVVIELKILHKGLAATLDAGLPQTLAYMDRCGAEQGHLVIFDRAPGKAWEERLFQRVETVGGKDIEVWGM